MASYTILQYFILLLAGGLLYFVFVYVADVFGMVQNVFINAFPGYITEQCITAGNFVIGLIVAAPFLVMLSLFIWAVVRQSTR